MEGTFLNFLLISAELVKVHNFIIITILTIIGIYYKKTRKFAVMIYSAYLGIFLMLFPINEYGADILTVRYIKKRLTPESFEFFKESIQNKDKKKKIISVYHLSFDIKYMTEKIKKDYKDMETALNNTKGIDRNFIPWTDTADRI